MKAAVLVIVDDEADMRLLIRVTLGRDSRLELVGEAGSAEEAIDVARETQPAAVVLDHGLNGSGMTGLQAAPLIKEVAPAAKIVLFTAYDMGTEAAAEPAIDAFVPKTDIRILLPVVDSLLGLAPLLS